MIVKGMNLTDNHSPDCPIHGAEVLGEQGTKFIGCSAFDGSWVHGKGEILPRFLAFTGQELNPALHSQLRKGVDCAFACTQRRAKTLA